MVTLLYEQIELWFVAEATVCDSTVKSTGGSFFKKSAVNLLQQQLASSHSGNYGSDKSSELTHKQ